MSPDARILRLFVCACVRASACVFCCIWWGYRCELASLRDEKYSVLATAGRRFVCIIVEPKGQYRVLTVSFREAQKPAGGIHRSEHLITPGSLLWHPWESARQAAGKNSCLGVLLGSCRASECVDTYAIVDMYIVWTGPRSFTLRRCNRMAADTTVKVPDAADGSFAVVESPDTPKSKIWLILVIALPALESLLQSYVHSRHVALAQCGHVNARSVFMSRYLQSSWSMGSQILLLGLSSVHQGYRAADADRTWVSDTHNSLHPPRNHSSLEYTTELGLH